VGCGDRRWLAPIAGVVVMADRTQYPCADCGKPRERQFARYCLDCAAARHRTHGRRVGMTTAELWRKWKAGELVEVRRDATER
jgi:hypothetical protein